MLGIALEVSPSTRGRRFDPYRVGGMTTRDRLRVFALSLPGAAEDFPWGESVVKVNGKVFVFLGTATTSGTTSGRRRVTVKLDESHGHALSVEGAQPTGYGLGRSGWVTLPLRAAGVTLGLLRDWVEESYRIVAPKRLVAELDRSAPTTPALPLKPAPAPPRSRQRARRA